MGGIASAIEAEDRAALYAAATRATARALRRHLAAAREALGTPGAARSRALEAQALYRAFADMVAQADPDRGRLAMERVGCGACHVIPGVWPQGEVGPRLGTFARRSLIAGRLPNRPDLLAAFVRDAPALVPGSAMPAMPLSEAEARDAAAYLYALDDR